MLFFALSATPTTTTIQFLLRFACQNTTFFLLPGALSLRFVVVVAAFVVAAIAVRVCVCACVVVCVYRNQFHITKAFVVGAVVVVGFVLCCFRFALALAFSQFSFLMLFSSSRVAQLLRLCACVGVCCVFEVRARAQAQLFNSSSSCSCCCFRFSCCYFAQTLGHLVAEKHRHKYTCTSSSFCCPCLAN